VSSNLISSFFARHARDSFIFVGKFSLKEMATKRFDTLSEDEYGSEASTIKGIVYRSGSASSVRTYGMTRLVAQFTSDCRR
jgi:hypothetical protein